MGLGQGRCGILESGGSRERLSGLSSDNGGHPLCHGKTMDKIAAQLFPFTKGQEREALLEACCRVENDYLREHGGMLYPICAPRWRF